MRDVRGTRCGRSQLLRWQSGRSTVEIHDLTTRGGRCRLLCRQYGCMVGIRDLTVISSITGISFLDTNR